MKTLTLSLIALSLLALAPPPVQQRLVVTLDEFPATFVIEGDDALVIVGTRVLGPVRWDTLPGIPGVEEATVGTTVCIKYVIPSGMAGGSTATSAPIHFTATGTSVGQAVAKLKAQLANATVVPCP